ncbi:MAG TPA: hypothetical protein VEQ84_03595 [Vicinamibacteria bacterium]|nr:hypothetical protein [Vicinamibacteria bacterium]
MASTAAPDDPGDAAPKKAGGVSRARPLAAALFGYVLLAAVFTWPLMRHPASHVIAHGVREATPALNTWAMAVVLHGLPRDPWHLFDGNAFYPYSDTLAFSEHMLVPALMAAPIHALSDNWVLAYNGVSLLTLVLAGCGMFLLARDLTGDAAASFVAGALYAFHTWNVNEMVRLQILSNEFFPLLLWALVRFFRAPTGWGAGAVALFYGLQSLSCMYWALYAPLVLMGASAVLAWRYRPRPAVLVRLAASLVVPALLVALVARPYVRSARALGFARQVPESVPIDRYFDVLPQNLLYARVLGTAGPNQNAAHFLGFAAIGLAVVASWPGPGGRGSGADAVGRALRPLLVSLVLVGILLSLGPRLRLGEWDLGPGPYAALYRWVPGFRNVRYPERFSILAILGLAPLVAAGLARLRPRLGAAGLAALGTFVLVEHLAIPQTLDALAGGHAIPEAYRWLATRDDVRVVAEVPGVRNRLERFDALPMYYSTAHWKRTVEGFTGYFPPSYNFEKWRLFHFPDPESVAFLERFGVDTLVVRAEGAPILSGAGRWRIEHVFPDGHQVVRLAAARAPDFPIPSPAGADLVELGRTGWDVQGSSPGAGRAVDGDVSTSWATPARQGKGEFFRVRFPRAVTVARISIGVADPYEFPMRLKLVGEDEPGTWTEIPFDEAAAYDRLFGLLLHRPREASLDLDIPPRLLRGFRLRIAETDAFAMPWTMAELRAYGPP